MLAAGDALRNSLQAHPCKLYTSGAGVTATLTIFGSLESTVNVTRLPSLLIAVIPIVLSGTTAAGDADKRSAFSCDQNTLISCATVYISCKCKIARAVFKIITEKSVLSVGQLQPSWKSRLWSELEELLKLDEQLKLEKLLEFEDLPELPPPHKLSNWPQKPAKPKKRVLFIKLSRWYCKIGRKLMEKTKMVNEYTLTLLGLFLILSTLVAQSFIAAIAKAKQPGAVPGKMNAELSHESFVFRSNRCMANSLENSVMMLGTVFLAIFANAHPKWIGIYTLSFAAARIVHMLLYYFIATEKNPSPRSYFYLIGFICNVALLVQIALTLLK